MGRFLLYEGSSPKYWINTALWYVWMTLFLGSLIVAATLGGLIYDIQTKWYKFVKHKDYKDVLRNEFKSNKQHNWKLLSE